MKFLVLSTSLSPSSRSRILARAAFDRRPDVHESTWMDLQTEGLPLCDGGPAADERVDRLRRAVASCDGILITFGIYNYLAPAATKNAVVRMEAEAVRPGSRAIREISANSVMDASIRK